VRVQRVESLPPGVHDALQWCAGDGAGHAQRWREHLALASDTAVLARFADGSAAVTRRGPVWYQAGAFDATTLRTVLAQAAVQAGLQPLQLPADVRVSRTAGLSVVQNFSNTAVDWVPPQVTRCLLGASTVPPQGLAVWK
jgi:beta-galactosidase